MVALTASVARHPDALAEHHNRCTCLLALGHTVDALDEARQIMALRPEVDAGYLLAGIAHWRLREYDRAVDVWRGGLDAIYTDDGRGLEVRRFLLFAGVCLGNRELQHEAIALMRKRWRPKLAQTWPRAVTGYLLGKLDEQAFLADQTFLKPILEARRQCRAYFWVAFQSLRAGGVEEYADRLHQVPRAENDVRLRATLMLEEEYWLTEIELARVASESS